MFNIKTMNAIAEKGLDELKAEKCAVSPEMSAPDALLIRSAKLHDAVFNKELLCIGRAGIGVDNIPIERCTAEGIAVFNTPGANADSVKELLLCALTMASRDIVGAVEWVESLAPEGDKIPALVEKGKNAFAGPEVSGKRLGVIGLGAIGSRVANAALKLDMEVSGYDPYLSVDSAWNLSSKVEHVTDLNVLFRTCDYLTMHIHSTPETFHYLNAETFAKMKPGMRILNFARGELVDDDALLAAIESGQVARYVTSRTRSSSGRKMSCASRISAPRRRRRRKSARSWPRARSWTISATATSATASISRTRRSTVSERAACASSTATSPACSTGFSRSSPRAT